MKANINGRHISFWTAISFVVASMIGTGVFTSLGFQLSEIKSIFPLLMLWILGGIIALSGALTYAELGTAFPRSGGEYNLLSRIIHPSIGFSAGIVSSTIGFTAPAVLAAMALGKYLGAIIPFLKPELTAFIVIITMHFLHMTSIRWGTFFQDYSTFTKVALVFIFIGFGFAMNEPQSISIMPVSGDGDIIMSSSFAISLVWVSYAYTGWNSSIYVSSELIDPKINISKVMIYSTIFVTMLYVLLNYVFLYSTPMGLMINQLDVGYLAGIQIFGDIGGKIMGLGIALLLLSTISSYVFIGPRIMQIMGEDHLFLKLLRRKNSDDIPINAFFVQLILALLFLVTSSFEQVLMYTGVTLIITTTLTILSLFVSRYYDPNLDRPYKTLGYPFTPLLFLVANIWILYFSFQIYTIESLISVFIIFGSMFLYWVLTKSKLYK